ncbi:p-loop-NTPase [Penaeus vannamei nudivirus]|nr:p-loop-NTPase [Penaeus vannamei nucleopolyhedrovirus]
MNQEMNRLHEDLVDNDIPIGEKFKQVDHDYSNYWFSMGFTSLQCLRSPKWDFTTKLEVLEDIVSNNREFFDNKTPPVMPVVSIDGTCCTGKSTICKQFNSIKTNRSITSIGMNTNPLSALGYTFTSLNLLRDFVKRAKDKEDVVLSDRTIFNNYQWSIIWQMIALPKHERCKDIEDGVNENAYTIINSIAPKNKVFSDKLLNMWNSLLENFNTFAEKEIAKYTKIIYLVDSDDASVRARMKKRAEGSDVERSEWQNYVNIQNFAYAHFAQRNPHLVCFIDIRKYINNDIKMADVMNIIVHLINTRIRPMVIKSPNDTNILFEPYEDRIGCSKITQSYRNHERMRPLAMDKFYSKYKVEYKRIKDEAETAIAYDTDDSD